MVFPNTVLSAGLPRSQADFSLKKRREKFDLALNGDVHVHDVVTDCSYALTGFLVSTLFGVSPGQSSTLAILHIAFLSGFPY